MVLPERNERHERATQDDGNPRRFVVMVMVTQLRWYQPWRTTRPPTATTAEARNKLQYTHYRAVCTLGPALAAKVRCSSSRSANACREGYLHHDVVLLS
jgi:hypothetical protein